MALPKRKHSKSRRDKRRSQWKLKMKGINKCLNCGALKLIHHICLNCGSYKKRPVLTIKEKKKE